MDSLVYLLLNSGALGTALAMGIWWHQPWLYAPKRSAMAVGLVGLIFVAWDIVATHVGHWEFSETYTTGLRLGGLPIEEYLFFVSVGLVCLAVWQRIRQPLGTAYKARVLTIPAGLAVLFGIATFGRGYSMTATVAVLVVCGLLAVSRAALLSRSWLRYQVVMFGLFCVFNTILTALPIVLYNDLSFSSWRIGTIPVEDFLYNFALINAVIWVYEALPLTDNQK